MLRIKKQINWLISEYTRAEKFKSYKELCDGKFEFGICRKSEDLDPTLMLRLVIGGKVPQIIAQFPFKISYKPITEIIKQCITPRKQYLINNYEYLCS